MPDIPNVGGSGVSARLPGLWGSAFGGTGALLRGLFHRRAGGGAPQYRPPWETGSPQFDSFGRIIGYTPNSRPTPQQLFQQAIGPNGVQTTTSPIPTQIGGVAPTATAPRPAPSVPQTPPGTLRYIGNGMFSDGFGGRTYSSTAAENKQFGYWGRNMYENPFGMGFLIGGGVSGRVVQPEAESAF